MVHSVTCPLKEFPRVHFSKIPNICRRDLLPSVLGGDIFLPKEGYTGKSLRDLTKIFAKTKLLREMNIDYRRLKWYIRNKAYRSRKVYVGGVRENAGCWCMSKMDILSM